MNQIDITVEVTQLQVIPLLQIDNVAVLKLAQNPELHWRTKHIWSRHFFIR